MLQHWLFWRVYTLINNHVRLQSTPIGSNTALGIQCMTLKTCCLMWPIKLCVINTLIVNCNACRKICKNCLCPREEHDINEDTSKAELQETHVGKILFSPTADTLTRKISGDIGGARSPKSVSSPLYLEHFTSIKHNYYYANFVSVDHFENKIPIPVYCITSRSLQEYKVCLLIWLICNGFSHALKHSVRNNYWLHMLVCLYSGDHVT